MSMRMYKMLFSQPNITKLNVNRQEKIVLHTYNNLCILQMRVCRITIINKGNKYQSSYFVWPGNAPALLGMPDFERLPYQDQLK